jgi:transposase
LNIDETWLGMSDFRRRKWQVKGTTNSVPKLQLAPRISMIAGVDTRGQVYLCLVQANNNSKVMEIYFRYLVKKLDKERPRWRHDTILLMDNAPYHKSSATMKVLEGLDIPICFTGPHSYDAAPCELLFAAFKANDINPRHIKTGKK